MSIGQQIGSYRILARTWRGDLQRVYKGVHKTSHELHLLKILSSRPSDGLFRKFLETFARVAIFDHYHLVKQMAPEYAGDRVLLPLRYFEAAPLSERIPRGPSSFEEVLEVALQISDVLSSLHDAGFLHEHLTAGMLFEDQGKQIYLAGPAWPGEVSSWEIPDGEVLCQSRSKVKAGRAAAALAYRAPEAIQGKGDARSDLYSLGVVLYELLTGRFLFDGEDSQGVRTQILEKPIPMLNQVRPDAPPIWVRILKCLLVRDPSRRYPSARELQGDLQQLRWGFSIEYPSFIKKSPNFNRRSFFRRFMPDIDL